MNTLYTASAVATGDGRNGHVQTFDGNIDAPVRTPKEMGGEGGATCFHSALKLVAASMKVDTTDSEVVADVSLGRDDNGAFGLAVRLEVALPNATPEVAQQVIEAAHQVCPYSNATRGNVDVSLTIV